MAQCSDHRVGLAGGVSLGLVIGCRSPHFGGTPGLPAVDSQVSPFGPRISKSEKNPRRSGGLDARQTERKAMPPRNSLISRLCHRRAWDEWDERGDGDDAGAPVPTESTKPPSRRRRVA